MIRDPRASENAELKFSILVSFFPLAGGDGAEFKPHNREDGFPHDLNPWPRMGGMYKTLRFASVKTKNSEEKNKFILVCKHSEIFK